MSSAAAYKDAMRHVPTAVTVVTSLRDGEPRGLTLNAFSSVAIEPPALLVCVNREARSYLYISRSAIFCVNVLARDQRRLAEHFSGKVRDRQFEDVAHTADVTGAPVLQGALAHFDCRVAEEHHFGSHSIIVGTVVSSFSRPGSPLGYFNGEYSDFGMAFE